MSMLPLATMQRYVQRLKLQTDFSRFRAEEHKKT